MNNVNYKNATISDTSLILQFIKELAEYEKLAYEVIATESDIQNSLFCDEPKAFFMIAEVDGAAAGFALCFYNYSTFQGKPGIYIEDLYVRDEFRGHGIGKGFFRELSKKALAEDCGRIQWWVLDWNAPSINFYKSLGTEAMDEWTVFRLSEKEIKSIAEVA